MSVAACATQSTEFARAPFAAGADRPTAWRFSTRGIAIRLFITCWMVYALHFATNIVREVFPAMAIAEHFSFRVDEYAGMHPDLFDKPGYGWHIGNNPGASIAAAIPFALCRPIIDPIVERVNRRRAEAGLSEPPGFDSPWPLAREFYIKAWQRGLDIKFGLAAFVMQTLCMAPSSALGVVAVFYVLRRVFSSDKAAFWLALLYAFGTPVFFRTGFLNHNLMLGHIAFLGFLVMWNPGQSPCCSTRTRYLLGGIAGGTALLFDYSGMIFLLGLFAYGLAKRHLAAGAADAARHGCWYVLGTLGPVGLLWFYQWQSFGHPFYPGQHWMPTVEWSELGYQGFGFPQFRLLMMLAFDYRFGLFVTCPLLLFAVAAPFLRRRRCVELPVLEMTTTLLLFVVLWVFFSGSNYTQLQFNTGIRYLMPIFPFLFIPAVTVLMRAPRYVVLVVAVFSVMEGWCLAMHRDVERGLGVLDPILHVFFGGFKLPALTTLLRTGETYGEFFQHGVSALPLFALTGALLLVLWARLPGGARASAAPRLDALRARDQN